MRLLVCKGSGFRFFPPTMAMRSSVLTRSFSHSTSPSVLSLPKISVEDTCSLLKNGSVRILDVRSPSEFAQDCLPCSENLPVLDDMERAYVGKLYRMNQTQARHVGAGYITQRIAKVLSSMSPSLSCTQDSTMVVYCARGGLRSQSLATVLSLIGYPNVKVMSGGYKSYREYVTRFFAAHDQTAYVKSLTFHVITGLTGTRKTETLHKLRGNGHQVLDLEGLANHRGSVLGASHEDPPQPSQKRFESRLFQALLLDIHQPAEPIWVEGESQRVGQVQIPMELWTQMMYGAQNKVFELQSSSQEDRIRFLNQEYCSWHDRPQELKQTLSSLERIASSNKIIKDWHECVDRRDFHRLVKSLLEDHYDLRYRQSKVSKALRSRATPMTQQQVLDFASNQRDTCFKKH